MTAQLDKIYNPEKTEKLITQKWADVNGFHADPDNDGAPFSIVIPPPNVTAPLHLGHALNNTLQDVLVRYHRMLGNNAVWLPGTDHAGIATQTVVDKRLRQENKHSLKDYKKMEAKGRGGRKKFVRRVQSWKDEYEKRITEQLKSMGCSCDWQRQRFTMDEQCAKAVRQAFFQLFKDGLIYRGKRLVNWDPVTQTALADDEVEMQEVDGNFWYLKYPLVEPEGDIKFVTVATTRPETMLGDTAVAVNPKDEKNAHLIGKEVLLPIVGRKIPIIGDDYVTIADGNSDDPKAQYASGFLKVTPAHDPNDWEIGQRHNLEVINIMAPDASISLDHGWPAYEAPQNNQELKPFVGLSREQAREAIVKWFEEHDLLADVKPYTHSVGHSYRSHAPIEPYLSDQWYVKVTDDKLAGAALRAMAQRQSDSASGRTGSSSGEAGSFSSGTGVSPVIFEGNKKDNTEKQNSKKDKPPITSKLTTSKRQLPHWQKGGSTYFITFRTNNILLNNQERQIVLDSCMHWHNKRAKVYLAVVMPDHVHLMISPVEIESGNWYSLSKLLHSIKSFSSHQINKYDERSGQIWQDEYFDRIIRDEEEFKEKWQYMQGNPVKAGLVKKPKNYQFLKSGVRSEDEGEDDRRDACPTDACPTRIEDCESGLSFTPSRYAKTFQNWHENIRDWCISRQLWWGHRIPVWKIVFSTAHFTKLYEIDSAQRHHKECVASLLKYLKACGVDAANICIQEDSFIDDEVVMAICSRDSACDEALELLNRVRQHHATQEMSELHKSREDRRNLIDRFGKDAADSIDSNLRQLVMLERDPDVLDTWFSSALWPLSTLGWPEDTKELQTWNPTSVLCTAREIITLWVSRMVMFNIYFRNCLPFFDVFIHAMIQDGHGQKMSKSLGNGVDPMDIIYSHGADSMRFTLASMTTHTQDVRMPVDMVCPHTNQRFTPEYITSKQGYKVAAPIQKAPDGSGKKMVSSYGYVSGLAKPTDDMPLARNTSKEFDIGQRFANKLWNAVRFALENLSTSGRAGVPLASAEGNKEQDFSLADKWILSRLNRAVEDVNSAINEFKFANYTEILYDFFRRDLCDWYIEAVKPTVKNNNTHRVVLSTCLDATLRMLHPIMPFITEQLWEKLNELAPRRGQDAGLAGIHLPAGKILMLAKWAKIDDAKNYFDKKTENTFEFIQNIVGSVREVRATNKIAPSKKIDISIKASKENYKILKNNKDIISILAGLDNIAVGSDIEKPDSSAATVLGDMDIYVHGAIDKEAEEDRLQKRKEELEKSINTLRGRLNNENYVNKAPKNLVQQTREQLIQVEKEYDALLAK